MRVDYWGIGEEIREVLDGDQDLNGVAVSHENTPAISLESAPFVGIYLDSRDAPAGDQSMSAGKKTRFLVTYSIWVWVSHIGDMADAARRRDDLLGKVEVALMGNRTLNDKVNMSWITGGQFESAIEEGSETIMLGGEIALSVDATASTD